MVFDKCSSLDVSPRNEMQSVNFFFSVGFLKSNLAILPSLLCDLHDEFMILLEAEVENAKIHSGTHVVNVGHEDELTPLVDQFSQ